MGPLAHPASAGCDQQRVCLCVSVRSLVLGLLAPGYASSCSEHELQCSYFWVYHFVRDFLVFHPGET